MGLRPFEKREMFQGRKWPCDHKAMGVRAKKMIKYQLICEKEHEFEGWFQSSDTFVEQCVAGILSCPFCETVNVRRALVAKNIE